MIDRRIDLSEVRLYSCNALTQCLVDLLEQALNIKMRVAAELLCLEFSIGDDVGSLFPGASRDLVIVNLHGIHPVSVIEDLLILLAGSIDDILCSCNDVVRLCNRRRKLIPQSLE